MKIILKQTNSNRVQLDQEAPFAESCIPLTIELARKNKARILPQLPTATKTLPYEDRVLLWLHPIWQTNIEQFHKANGRSMWEMFYQSPHKFNRFDDHYSEKLRNWLMKNYL